MSSSQNRRLVRQVNLGLTETEAMTIDREARASNLSRAGFIRRQVLAMVRLPETTKPRRYATMATADIVAVAELIASLGRASGATVQLAKVLRRAGHPSHHEVEQVLAELREQSIDAASLIERLSDQR